MATAPTGYTLVDGPSGSAGYPALVYKDANGGLATITTPWYLNASGVYIPAPVDANGNPQMSITGSSAPLPSPGQKDLVGGSSGVAPFTLATSTSYTSSTLDYLGNRKVSAFFNDAGASTSPTYTLAVNCLAVGAYGGTINSSTIDTTIGYSFVGPIEIVTGSTNVVVTNSSTTNTLAVYQLSLGVQ